MAKKEKTPSKPQLHPLLEKAQTLDAQDELSYLRGKFHIPAPQGQEQAYFCHHRLGLQPKRVRFYLEDLMERWRRNDQQEQRQIQNVLNEKMAMLVGARGDEVMLGYDLPSVRQLLMDYFSNKAKLVNAINLENGDVSDFKKCADQAHAKGELIGFDLSAVVGDLELKLHDWEIDFAIWSGQHYLSGGPGALAGSYIHQRHLTKNAPPLAPSLPSLFACAPLMASLEVLSSVPFKAVEAKKKNLLNFFHTGIKEYAGEKIKIISSAKSLSGIFILEVIDKKCEAQAVASKLKTSGAIADVVAQHRLMFSLSAMANSYEDVARTIIGL